MIAGALHFIEQIIQWLGVGHKNAVAHDLGDADTAAAISTRVRLLDNVLQVNDADDVLNALANHRQSRVT